MAYIIILYIYITLPILTNCIHCTPLVPIATMENPMVDPTMQCVPEMGNLRKEAMSCQTADPVKKSQMD